MSRLAWPSILERGAEIVESYSTPVTLRQLHYRLVAEGAIPNTASAYKTLSSRSAEARREGVFPALADNTREVWRPFNFDSIDQASRWLALQYRRDRTHGQAWNVFLGVEKATMTAQLVDWFSDWGVAIVALRGYASQTLADDVAQDVAADGRPAVLLYAGDHDATGEDVLRDFEDRTRGSFDQVVRVALSAEQVDKYNLPPMLGKRTDPRAAGFEERHGRLVQVELEALDPDLLRDLYTDALLEFWDTSAWASVVEAEDLDRLRLREVRP